MDAILIGENIARLRKMQGLTQQELAERLNVSNKAVSKWENGQGYPDIEHFPVLANLFGVSVDYLMNGQKKGITVAGNMLVDVVKNIESFPKPGMLAYISESSRAVGGCVPNVAIDLAKIDRSLPVYASGRLGNDENGRYVLSQLQINGVNTDRVVLDAKEPTGYSDVMSVPSGERTFFHQKGANINFVPGDVQVKSLECDIFHIGYILLLDAMDAENEKYGTVMAGLLKDVQSRGIKTSVDVVSSNEGGYAEKIIPALKHCNYLIINEIECCAIFDIPAYDESGNLDKSAVKLAMQKCAEHGVSDKVIVHCKEIGFALDVKSGQFTQMPSLEIPKEEIKGSVGAGDAYCAGCLYGLYNGYTDEEILEFAASAAACNLFAANSVDGMKPKTEIDKISKKYGRKMV